jgi:hypothetical protein
LEELSLSGCLLVIASSAFRTNVDISVIEVEWYKFLPRQLFGSKKTPLKIRLERWQGAGINGLYIIARHDIMLTNIRLFGHVTDEKVLSHP